jgi:predicted ArsR family transcriptional regulator
MTPPADAASHHSSQNSQDTAPTDNLNAKIGVLTRREVEARILGPVIEALAQEFDRERVIEVLRETIVRIAREQGAQLAQSMGGTTLEDFADSLHYWTQDNALEIELLEKSPDRLDFNVTRCRYAELYRALGLADLGAVLSCNRDYALIEGFNGDVELSRTQTIMEGASHCNFRYRRTQSDG